MENNLIAIEQPPIIKEQLATIKNAVTERVSGVLSLEVTEDTLKEVKKERAELNKEFAALEEKRKEVKKKVLEPYQNFEKVYKECAADIYKSADAELSKRIKYVENTIKDRKRLDVEDYFKELVIAKNLQGLIGFNQAEINVTLSASVKSLKEQVEAFVDRVSEDVKAIAFMFGKDEILAEYKDCLNMTKAVETVRIRQEAVKEAERKRLEREQAEEERRKRAEEVKAVADAEASAPEAVSIPEKAEVEVKPEQKAEPVYIARFAVKGTREKIKALVEFMKENGYEYESIK